MGTRNDWLTALTLTPALAVALWFAFWLRFEEWPTIAWVLP